MFVNKVYKLTLYSPQKCYRREAVETGFSMGYHYRSAPIYHYRYEMVFDGTYRNVVVWFSKKIRLKIKVKEESLLYKELIKA
jgi:hypothetical protein